MFKQTKKKKKETWPKVTHTARNRKRLRALLRPSLSANQNDLHVYTKNDKKQFKKSFGSPRLTLTLKF